MSETYKQMQQWADRVRDAKVDVRVADAILRMAEAGLEASILAYDLERINANWEGPKPS